MNKPFNRQKIFIVLLIITLLMIMPYSYANKALLLKVDSAISPAVADYIVRGIEQAKQQQAQLIIIQLDTPGGLDKSMRSIVKAYLASTVPIVTFVAPSGARAASAGTFMLYASHIAAMAPGTNLGAASPVQVGGGGGLPKPSNTPHEDETNPKQTTPKQYDSLPSKVTSPNAQAVDKQQNKSPNSADNNVMQEPSSASKKPVNSNEQAMRAKVTNDASAYIRSLAELHGRNVKWAEAAVREASTLTAEAAFKQNVIDIVANDVSDLLTKLNGRIVKLKDKTVQLDTKNINIVLQEPDWRNKFLTVITDPSVAYILLLVGIYGLFFEFANPGFVIPGVAGAISLLLAMYALQLLPISFAGLGLILLGMIFMVAEAFIPSFGALGIGGVIAFVVGSVLLFDSDLPGFQIAWPIIAGAAIVNAAFFLLIVTVAIKSFSRKTVIGIEVTLVGAKGKALETFTSIGQIRVHGEIWKAQTNQPIQKNQEVIIVGAHGLKLIVEPNN
ncbi:MAG: nodulation protein NfeD [Gammaproteobacteria bacterium]